jgi:type II secretory pathway pseudopilin PulG
MRPETFSSPLGGSAPQLRSARHLLREQNNQNGFALIAVLAVIAITSVTIGALLGMMLTAIKITENQERDARQARAADGAVTAAINQLRLNQTAAVDACLPGVPAPAGLPLTFESSGRSDTATVTCSSAAGELGESVGGIKLWGIEQSVSDTERDWKFFQDSSEVSSDLKELIIPSETNLVHWGNSALKFNGNLSSNGGAVPFRYDPEGTPALDVRGTYAQASQGIGAEADAVSSCGALSGAAAVAATTVRASAGAKCGDPVLIPVSIAGDDIDLDPQTKRDLSAGAVCPDETVIEFEAGKYDQEAVATLNKWFGRGDGSCTNKTFYFKKGRYWFDANTVINGVGAENQHALTFNNPTSTFVFGQANGWDEAEFGVGATSANFPKACDPAKAGAKIILSGRTELHHLSGRLAACPLEPRTATTGKTDVALEQQGIVPTKVTTVKDPEPTTPTPPGPESIFEPKQLVENNQSKPAKAAFSCKFSSSSVPDDGTPLDGAETCSSKKAFSVTLSSAMSGPIFSASLDISGEETVVASNGLKSREVRISVKLKDNKGSCVSDARGAPLPPIESDKTIQITTYDFLTGECSGLITRGEQLDGAEVSVTYKYTFNCVLPLFFCDRNTIVSGHALWIWNVEVVANRWSSSAASVEPSSGWKGELSNLLQDNGSSIEFCLPGECPQPGGFKRTFTMKEFGPLKDPAGKDLPPASHLESLGVVIKQKNMPDETQLCFPNNFCTNGGLEGSTTLTLTLKDQTRCPASFRQVPSQTGTSYLDLLDRCKKDGISAELDAKSIEDASLKVEYEILCTNTTPRCPSFDLPAPIQYVGLVATSDSYSKVIKSQLTIDSAAPIPVAVAAGGSTGGPASANFFGSADLKNVALDLNWNGKASGASLFGGELQLNSLGSLMKAKATADVVCCTAPETNIRKVRLTAWVGGEAKLSAVVALNSKEKTAPVVLEWTVCGRNGNCSP